MNPTHLMPLTGTITLRATNVLIRDEMGDPTVTETTRTFRCWWQQESRDEDTALTDVQRERRTLFLEPAAAGVVDGSAAITIDGITYEFDGPPWPALNPRTNAIVHVESYVRRTV